MKRPTETTGGVFYLLVLATVGAGILVSFVGYWRRGVLVIAGATAVASAARAALPDGNAGMLRVRTRLIDTVGLAMAAGVLAVLAVNIPDQAG